jgi:RloB-like protein
MDYNIPSKAKANEDYLRSIGFKKETSPYEEEKINEKKSFLIICEGENTEPLYFKNFPVPTNTVIIEGGRNTKTSLVDYALKVRGKQRFEGREVWCVFDYDVKPDEAATQPQDFNNAITKAESHGMKVAWSNDAFELWFVLHYQKLDVRHTRNELFPILKKEWELKSFSKIAKTQNFCEGHYDRHLIDEGRLQKLAISRARELHEKYIGREDFANHCPCTTIYLLVEELNKNLKR